jgi:excinuclease UvrABC ATPase subunit
MSPKPNKRKQKQPKAGLDVGPDIKDIPVFSRPLPVIKVVGISGSGKSTLVRALRAQGYDARPVSQEHSNVPTLWQQFDHPTYLIYLNAALEDQQARRQDVTWSADAHLEEVRRLSHAREHADLRIDTAGLNPAGVLNVAISYLIQRGVRRADHALDPLPPTGGATKSSRSHTNPSPTK